MDRSDYEVVLAAVQSNGESLAQASANLRNDRRIVAAALAEGGSFIERKCEEMGRPRDAIPLLPLASDALLEDRNKQKHNQYQQTQQQKQIPRAS
eukprot:2944246-Amphidinium_carterae.1